MNERKSTVEILRDFFHPGHEGRHLDFKSKELTESTEGRRKLIKHICGFANREGGTIVIGADGRHGKYLLQDFSRDSEIIRDLSNIVRDCTEPPLTPLYEANFVPIEVEEVSDGVDFGKFDDIAGMDPESGVQHLLRIDIQPVDRELIKFDGELFFRGEDGTRPMKDGDIDHHYQEVYRELFREARESPETTLSRIERLELDPTNKNNLEKQYQWMENRFVTIGENYPIVVPSKSLWTDEYGQRLLYSLDGRPEINSFTELKKLLNNLDFSFARDFRYSIKFGSMQWSSSGVNFFINDLQNPERPLSEFGEEMEDSNLLPEDNSSRSLYGVAVCPLPIGIFSIYAEPSFRDNWDSDFENIEVELLVQNIPFDDTELKDFFDHMKCSPGEYKQKSGLQRIKFQGAQTKLHNPQPVHLEAEKDALLFVSADNPFYRAEEDLQLSLDNPIPSHMAKGICATDKLCYQISGGSKGFEYEDNFTVNYINVLYSEALLEPVCYVDAHCWAHEKEDTDVYPEPFSPFESEE